MSIEVCPHCGGEAAVHIHTTSAGVAVMSGKCGNCERLIAYRLTPETEPTRKHEAEGTLLGWDLQSYDEVRGWRTRRYSPCQEWLLHRHVIEYEETLTQYILTEVRA